VLGLSVVRGSAVPIVDAGRLLGDRPSIPTRVVMLRVGERTIGLLVEAVLGVRSMSSASVQELPPLIRTADADVLAAIGALDAELLVVLSAARIVPDEILASMEAEALAS
jgi:purine-binding chemotaxis protein CheW